MKVVPPKRVSRSYTQTLVAPPEAVFPLLCPVREADWIPDWDALLVVSTSGVAEEDCVFITEAGADKTFWYTTRYEPKNGFIEFVRFTPGLTATRLSIQLAAVAGAPPPASPLPTPAWAKRGMPSSMASARRRMPRSCRSGRSGSTTT